MADARCSCGALTLTLPGLSKLVLACHCLDCQRRTGAPFGVGAFYPVDAVVVSVIRKNTPAMPQAAGRSVPTFVQTAGQRSIGKPTIQGNLERSTIFGSLSRFVHDYR